MKKIAFVINNAYSYAGTENICNFMSDCYGELYDLTIFSVSGEGDSFYPYRKVKKIINYKEYKNPIKKIVDDVNKNNFDYVFVISMGKLSVMYSFWNVFSRFKNNDCKLFACEHVAIHSFNSIVRFLKFIFLRFYDKVIVLTDKDKTILQKWGVNSLKIANPISFKNFDRHNRTYHALAVGRLEHQKGFDLLLDIWRSFSINNKNWKLFIAGDGLLHQQLSELIKNYNIEDTVTLLGKVKDIDKFYAQSDMLLMTSRYEGLPLVLLEAKSWSLPVIAYDCPTGPREIIENNIDGFLIPINNKELFVEKMNLLSTDDECYFKLSKNTKKTSLKFDSQEIKNKWISLVS
ncbi:TPA: glycosyltransferase [Klebsiella pneumoniae]